MNKLTTDARWKIKRGTRDLYGDYPDCPYCGTPFYWSGGEVDHIIARAAGGQITRSNMVLACRDCNRRKSGHRPREWMLRMGYSLNDCLSLLQDQGKNTEWLL